MEEIKAEVKVEAKADPKSKAKKDPNVVNLVEKYKRKTLDDCLTRRFFVVPSYEIYGGVAGFYDYGPPGCALKNNIEAYWREHFILEENMLEICNPCITPEVVFKASGHVEKFTDFSVSDVVTGNVFRADKLIQEYLEDLIQKKANAKKITDKDLEEIERLKNLCSDVDKMDGPQLDEVIEKMDIRSPDKKNKLTKAAPLNLMFSTKIGPANGIQGYLRPETAQAHFVNFKRLLDFNSRRIPFASACIGLGFRNEISPRSGLLRVREFQMAEIEHYVDPLNKTHPKFKNIRDLKIPLLSQEVQIERKPIITDMTMGEAVALKIIDNETLAYFLARTYLFMLKIGINKDGLRARQHLRKEMAHYATDCWDIEIETSYGWIETVGHADRTCYDLSAHANESKVELVAARKLKEPVIVKSVRVSIKKQNLFKNLGKEVSTEILKVLETLTNEQKDSYLQEFQQNKRIAVVVNGQKHELNEEYVTFELSEEKQHEEKYVPGVIEPAFGIGRIVYCVLEHCFRIREKDEKRTFFAFPPLVAPVKVSILPLIDNDDMKAFIEPLRRLFVANGISYKIDDVADNIGRRYARTDELGIPFACTIDNQTLADGTVTLREIYSMAQIRVNHIDVAPIMRDVINQQVTWEDMLKKYPGFEQKKEDTK